MPRRVISVTVMAKKLLLSYTLLNNYSLYLKILTRISVHRFIFIAISQAEYFFTRKFDKIRAIVGFAGILWIS
jgi:hypothetical protein